MCFEIAGDIRKVKIRGLGTMKKRFAICVDNKDYPASLEFRKVYRVLPDADAEKDGFVRVVDESGEDYLYPIDVPKPVEKALERAGRAGS